MENLKSHQLDWSKLSSVDQFYLHLLEVLRYETSRQSKDGSVTQFGDIINRESQADLIYYNQRQVCDDAKAH